MNVTIGETLKNINQLVKDGVVNLDDHLAVQIDMSEKISDIGFRTTDLGLDTAQVENENGDKVRALVLRGFIQETLGTPGSSMTINVSDE